MGRLRRWVAETLEVRRSGEVAASTASPRNDGFWVPPYGIGPKRVFRHAQFFHFERVFPYGLIVLCIIQLHFFIRHRFIGFVIRYVSRVFGKIRIRYSIL